MIIKLNSTMRPEEHCYHGIMAQLVQLETLAKTLRDPAAVNRWGIQYKTDIETVGSADAGVVGDEIIEVLKQEREIIQLSDSGLGYHIVLERSECSAEQIVYREGIVGPPLELARHITFVHLAKLTFARVLEAGVASVAAH